VGLVGMRSLSREKGRYAPEVMVYISEVIVYVPEVIVYRTVVL
jgi:hypothetical protein